MKLSGLRPGEAGRVRAIEGSGAMKRRLVDMGVTPGVLITVRKVAPLGDPIQVTLRGYELSLRRADAAKILLEGREQNRL